MNKYRATSLRLFKLNEIPQKDDDGNKLIRWIRPIIAFPRRLPGIPLAYIIINVVISLIALYTIQLFNVDFGLDPTSSSPDSEKVESGIVNASTNPRVTYLQVLVAGAGAMILFRLKLGVKLGGDQTIGPDILLKSVIEILDREVGRKEAVELLETARQFGGKYPELIEGEIDSALEILKQVAYTALNEKNLENIESKKTKIDQAIDKIKESLKNAPDRIKIMLTAMNLYREVGLEMIILLQDTLSSILEDLQTQKKKPFREIISRIDGGSLEYENKTVADIANEKSMERQQVHQILGEMRTKKVLRLKFEKNGKNISDYTLLDAKIEEEENARRIAAAEKKKQQPIEAYIRKIDGGNPTLADETITNFEANNNDYEKGEVYEILGRMRALKQVRRKVGVGENPKKMSDYTLLLGMRHVTGEFMVWFWERLMSIRNR